MNTALAFWIAAPGTGELREEVLPPASQGQAKIETLYSGISRGSERLVFRGEVPAEERERMRCPLQEGTLPGPVKYGYAAVGRILGGPRRVEGRTVFCLHPHQDRFTAPADMAMLLPEGVPPARAVLGANMETALNILWDAACLPGDRIAIVGAGVLGLLVASLARRIPGVEVTLVDLDPGKAALAAHFGCRFALPDAAPQDCDVVVHASGSPEGLGTALASAGFEATVVEASWYGSRTVEVGLGGAFHSRRLKLVSSQVGSVAPARRSRRTHADRLGLALTLLADPALDALISGESDFRAMAEDYPAILDDPATLCHRIRYL